MTTEQRKEELKKKFAEWLNKEHDNTSLHLIRDEIFEFFYSEIEARDKQIENTFYIKEPKWEKTGGELKDGRVTFSLYWPELQMAKEKIQRLEEIIKAADEAMSRVTWNQGYSYHEALERYKELLVQHSPVK